LAPELKTGRIHVKASIRSDSLVLRAALLASDGRLLLGAVIPGV